MISLINLSLKRQTNSHSNKHFTKATNKNMTLTNVKKDNNSNNPFEVKLTINDLYVMIQELQKEVKKKLDGTFTALFFSIIVFICFTSTNFKIDSVDEKLTSRIDFVYKELTAKIDSVESKLNAKIDSVESKLNAKIDSVEFRLNAKIDRLDQKFTSKFEMVDYRLNALELQNKEILSIVKDIQSKISK